MCTTPRVDRFGRSQAVVTDAAGAPSLLPVAADALVVRAPAKLNLSLAVLARRADGYHEIESLMVPVSLHDTLRVRPAAAPGVKLAVRFGGRLATVRGRVLAGDVPEDGRNLAVRGVELLAAEAGLSSAGGPPGLEIEIVKRIPAGSGLGGGSSDAAAAIRAAAIAWGIDWPLERLRELGGRIGSDVPMFFASGAAISRGRGERIETVPGIPALAAVIARPAAGLSTAAVYAACRPDEAGRGGAARLADSLAAGRFRAALARMHNTLELPARDLCPDVARLLADFARHGAARPMLTGSGSAVFTLARSAVEARRIAARLDLAGWPGVFVVRLLPGVARDPPDH